MRPSLLPGATDPDEIKFSFSPVDVESAARPEVYRLALPATAHAKMRPSTIHLVTGISCLERFDPEYAGWGLRELVFHPAPRCFLIPN